MSVLRRLVQVVIGLASRWLLPWLVVMLVVAPLIGVAGVVITVLATFLDRTPRYSMATTTVRLGHSVRY